VPERIAPPADLVRSFASGGVHYDTLCNENFGRQGSACNMLYDSQASQQDRFAALDIEYSRSNCFLRL
jgi:hypothetical protein